MQRFCKRILLSVLLVFAGACGGIGVAGLSEDIFPADAIVIPGNAIAPDGTPSDRLAARLERGRELFVRGQGRYIIVSGGTGREGVDEAKAMRRWLLERGVPDERIIVDSNGNNTRATARFCAAFFKERGFTRALAVTQYFHVPRTALALEQEGVPAVGKAYARYVEWRDIYSLAREVPGYVYYFFR